MIGTLVDARNARSEAFPPSVTDDARSGHRMATYRRGRGCSPENVTVGVFEDWRLR